MRFTSRLSLTLCALISFLFITGLEAQMDLSKSLSSPAPVTVPALAPASQPAAAAKAPVVAKLSVDKTQVKPGDVLQAVIELDHEEHWHVYGATIAEGEFGKPTKFDWTLPEGWTIESKPWPATQELASTNGTKIQGYEGKVSFAYLVKVPETAQIGATPVLEVKFSGLVCDPKSCRPVSQVLQQSIKIGEGNVASAEAIAVLAEFKKVESASTAPNESAESTPEIKPVEKASLRMVLLAFLGGLILNVMPCVFPVLGIKIMGIAKQSGDDRAKIFAHSLAYTFGVLLCFWLLVFVLNALKAAGSELAWGFQLQSPVFVSLLTLGLFAFGLNMAGVFEVGTSAVSAGSQYTQKSGVAGSFFSGLFATVVATPCAAPFLAPTLGYALSLDLWPALVMFTVIGLGLAFPYLLIPFFPNLLKLLPRPGVWMESFKQAMSFLLFGTAAYLLWVYGGLVDEFKLRQALFGLVSVGAACWIYGRWFLPHKPKKTRVVSGLIALALATFGVALAYPSQEEKLVWQDWSPELEAQLEKEGKPVYVDYTARWCVTCQTNKIVYKSEALQKLFKEKGVVLLRADWTKDDPRITRALAELDRAAIPVNTLKKPGEKERYVLPELLTVGNVTEYLNKL